MVCNGYSKTTDELIIGVWMIWPLLVLTVGIYIRCLLRRWVKQTQPAVKRHLARSRRWGIQPSMGTPMMAYAHRGSSRRNWSTRGWR